MEIRRDIYLNKLVSKRHNGLIKVVTGLHRWGNNVKLEIRKLLHAERIPVLGFFYDAKDTLCRLKTVM